MQPARKFSACPADFGEHRTRPGREKPLNRCDTRRSWPVHRAIEHQVSRARGEWQQEIKIDRPGAPLVLLMRGSRLPLLTLPARTQPVRHVVVFDDVTILNQAQREAAWAEVARRLAHEVKNPLTPIRLAAERLRMKLADKLEAADSAMLDKASSTIVAQVEALRKLVDAFGDYAQEPELQPQPFGWTNWSGKS